MLRQLLKWILGILVALLIAGGLGLYFAPDWSGWKRLPRQLQALRPTAAPQAQSARDENPPAPTAVTRVVRADLTQDLSVEAEFRPYQEIDLHAKVTGYLHELKVDIGDRVREGQLLAVLEIPELGNEIEHAEASASRCQEEIRRAQAEYDEVQLAYARLLAVDKAQPNLLAQQELDLAKAKADKAAATVKVSQQQLRVAQADLKKLQTMLGYAQIAAPFAGVITKRGADPGALIQAGVSASAQPLLRLSDIYRLRLVFPVTAAFAARVREGGRVEIKVATLGKTLAAPISRITRKLETATRTMDVEVEVENPELRILPGMYATVTWAVEERKQVLAVAVEAIADRAASTVWRVNRERRLESRLVRLGLETPRQVEVIEGVQEGDQVVFGSRAQLRLGQEVEPRAVSGARIP